MLPRSELERINAADKVWPTVDEGVQVIAAGLDVGHHAAGTCAASGTNTISMITLLCCGRIEAWIYFRAFHKVS